MVEVFFEASERLVERTRKHAAPACQVGSSNTQYIYVFYARCDRIAFFAEFSPNSLCHPPLAPFRVVFRALTSETTTSILSDILLGCTVIPRQPAFHP